eukprot:74573_1
MAQPNLLTNKLDPNEIDKILDEIEQNEAKFESNHTNETLNQATSNVNWTEILSAIRVGNINYIKNLITSNDIDINAQNPIDGKTLLIYSVIIGNIDLLKVVANFGADVHIKDFDNDDALDYATKYGRYKITELLYYQQLSGTLGNDLKEIATQIHEKNKEAQIMSKHIHVPTLLNFMTKAMKNRFEFGADILYYSWYFTVYCDPPGGYQRGLKSKLWIAMMKTFETILADTHNKNGWNWLKRYFINSLIWYLPHPNAGNGNGNDYDIDGDEAVGDNMNKVLQKTLFSELLERVRNESKKQSDRLLKEKISVIRRNKPNEWRELASYNVNTKHSKNARQDLCGCIIPIYTEQQLSENIYPPSTHFSAKKHYDTNIYLNELIFRANIMNSLFQKDIKLITKEICLENNISVSYRAGPVKTLTRSQTKVENDYINEDWPTSARILDINRCALEFKSINDMMKYIEIFANKIKTNAAYSIVDIIRCKNGWSIYNSNYPQYTDIKLNVLVRSNKNKTIIAELQFLLQLMSKFKKVAHKLYSIERKFDLVYNYGLLTEDMTRFNDVNGGNNGVISNLSQNDEIKYFKVLWNMIMTSEKTLIDVKLPKNVYAAAIFNIMNKNGKINNYLKTEFIDLYFNTTRKYLQKYIRTHCGNKGYGAFEGGCPELIKHIGSNKKLYRFVEHLFDLIQNSQFRKQKLLKLLSFYKDKPGVFADKKKKPSQTIVEGLCESKKNLKHCVQFMLNTSLINDNDKGILFWGLKNANNKPFSCACKVKDLYNALQIIYYVKNDKKIFKKLMLEKYEKQIALQRICENPYGASTKIIELILNKKYGVFDEFEKKKLFIQNDSVSNSLCYNENSTKLSMVINYFFPPNANSNNCYNIELIKWLENRNYNKVTAQCLFYIFSSYFTDKRSKSYLLRILSRENNKLFNKICAGWMTTVSNKNHVASLQFILYNSPLNDKERKQFINSISPKYGPRALYYDNAIYDTGYEIIKYFSNDRAYLLKFIGTVNSATKVSVWHTVCNGSSASTSKHDVKVLKLILNPNKNQINVTQNDKNKLFSTKCFKNKTFPRIGLQMALAMGGSNTYNILNCFRNEKSFLIKLLMKISMRDWNRKPVYKQCFLLCERAGDMEIIFDVLNDNKIITKLINMFTLKDFDFGYFGNCKKYVILPFIDYLKFNKALDNSFFIQSLIKQYKHNPFITALRFGKIRTIKKMMNLIKSSKIFMKLLSKKHSNMTIDGSYKEYTALMYIVMCKYNNNNEELNVNLLKLLLLNNPLLSD